MRLTDSLKPRLLASLRPSELAELQRIATSNPRFFPLPGPQIEAFHSKADEVYFGGSAGPGKTATGCGLAIDRHRKSRIYRREYTHLSGVQEEIEKILGGTGYRYNGQNHTYRLDDGRSIRLGAMQMPDDWMNFQGNPADLLFFDELPHFTETQWRMSQAWCRSTDPNQICQSFGAGNPPTNSEGEWVIRYWAAWLDPSHPNPAKPGELRYYVRKNDMDVEVPNGSPVEINGHMVTPRSRTFIPAKLSDNIYQNDGRYRATLEALPDAIRAKLLDGVFSFISGDDDWQIIPSSWVEAAFDRWDKRDRPNISMTAIGADISRGGVDETVIARRYGTWFAPLISVPGVSVLDGPKAAALILAHSEGVPSINLDVLNVGWSVLDSLHGSNARVVSCNASETSDDTDRTGYIRFANNVTKWYWKFREALDPDTGMQLAIPRSAKLKADLCAWHYTLAPGAKIVRESKDKVKARLGRSPDSSDATVLAWAHGGIGMYTGAVSAPIIGTHGLGSNMV